MRVDKPVKAILWPCLEKTLMERSSQPFKLFHSHSRADRAIRLISPFRCESGFDCLISKWRVAHFCPDAHTLFRVQKFGLRFSGYGFRVSGFGFRVSGFEIRVSGVGLRASGFGGRTFLRGGCAKYVAYGIRVLTNSVAALIKLHSTPMKIRTTFSLRSNTSPN